MNLVNNAHHAMEEQGGGELEMKTIYLPDFEHVIVEVRDSGHGIPETVLAKIFDPFFTTKPVGKGTGLGLSVSYGIIKDHGGTIEVESPIVDEKTGEKHQGTVFRVIFPAASETDVVS